MGILWTLLFLGAARRKQKPQTEDPNDAPVPTAPEYGKVWHPDMKKWSHFVGRERHALVAFIENDPPGGSLSLVMEGVLKKIDKSKLNLVVAENWRIPQIIEEQGVTDFPAIYFYKAGMKTYSMKYEGVLTAKAISKWAMDKVMELDEWENLEDY